MTLYNNGIIILEYDDASDILCAACPDIKEIDLLQIHDAFKRIASTIGAYGIRNLLLDFSKTAIDVSDEDYKIVINQFDDDLRATCVKKIARIATRDSEREKRMAIYYKELKEKRERSAIKFRNFATKAAALEWLTTK